MPEKNDARLRFLLLAEHAIVIAIEQPKNGFIGSFSVPVFKDLDRIAFRKVLPYPLCKFHRAVMRIIVAHKAARKTDQDVRECR